MPLTPETLPRHELTGLAVSIEEASNADLVGIAGHVRRETTNTIIVVDGTGSTVQVPKRHATFRFELPDGTLVDVAGERLQVQPARRTETRGASPWV